MKLVPTRADLLDTDTLMRIRSLSLRAKVIVEGFYSGLHRSPYHGFSAEFSEYRQYSPGDDLRYLDWRLYARSDRYYIKRFEDETNLRCDLVVDLSRSMQYGSSDWTKAEYAKTAAATFAYFLAQQRDAVGVLTFADRVLDYLPARHRPGHLHRLLGCLERAPDGSDTDLTTPLDRIARIVTKRGLVVLISDLLAPVAALEGPLRALRARGHEVVLWRVLDPSEVELQLDEPTILRDLETGRELYVDPDSARAAYRRRFGEHAAELARLCSSLGVDLQVHPSDQPLELALFDFVRSRERAVRSAASRTAAPGGLR